MRLPKKQSVKDILQQYASHVATTDPEKSRYTHITRFSTENSMNFLSGYCVCVCVCVVYICCVCT